MGFPWLRLGLRLVHPVTLRELLTRFQVVLATEATGTALYNVRVC